MNIFKLFATITLNSESYKKGMAEAKKENQNFEQETQKTSKAVIAAWLAVIAVIVKVAQTIIRTVTETSAWGSEITKLSQKLGLSKQAVQEWDYVAQQNGTTVESLSTAMRNLSNMAVENNEDLLNLIGTVKDSNGEYKTQEQLLRETLAALNAIPNQQERNAAANKILGRSYQELGGLINMTTAEIDAQINTAHELGLVLSDDVVNAANKMDKELSQLSMMRKAAFAQLIFGDPAEGERLLNEYIEKIIEMAPKFVEAGLKIAGAFILALGKYFLPGIIGFAAGMATAGPIGAIVGFFAGMGIKAGSQALAKAISGESSSDSGVSSISTSDITNAYTSSTETKQKIDINITAEGDTPTGEQLVSDITKELLTIINTASVSM